MGTPVAWVRACCFARNIAATMSCSHLHSWDQSAAQFNVEGSVCMCCGTGCHNAAGGHPCCSQGIPWAVKAL